MHFNKPFGHTANLRPWGSKRYKSRRGMLEQLRRDYGGDATAREAAEVIGELSAPARRDLREGVAL